MIVANPVIRPGTPWRTLLNHETYAHIHDGGPQQSYWRPLVYSTYRLTWELGGGEPRHFHRTSLLLHYLCTALVAAAFLALGLEPWTALAGAALFAFHPLVAEVVYWAPAMTDELQVAPTLLALVLAIASRRANGWKKAALVTATTVATALTLFAKEAGVTTAPFLTLEAALTVGAGDFRRRLRASAPVLAAAWATTLGYLALRAVLHPPSSLTTVHPPLLWALSRGGLALGWYLGKLALPWPLTHVHPFPLDPALGPLDLLGALVLATAGILLAALAIRRRDFLFWALWLLMPLAPSLAFHFYAGRRVTTLAVVAERYIYPAVVPFVGIVAQAGAALLARIPTTPRRRAVAGALAVTVASAVGGLVTARYGATFNGDPAMFANAYRFNPSNPFVLNQLAAEKMRAGDVAGALPLLERAVAAAPDTLASLLNLGSALVKLGRHAEAVPVVERALTLDPRAAGAHILFGDALTGLGRNEAAAARYGEAATIDPRNLTAWVRLGAARVGAGDRHGAAAAWEQALPLAGEAPELLFQLARVSREEGARERARDYARRFLAASRGRFPAEEALARGWLGE